MVSLSTAAGEFVGFFDSEGEALMHAAANGISEFRIDNPFKEQ